MSQSVCIFIKQKIIQSSGVDYVVRARWRILKHVV